MIKITIEKTAIKLGKNKRAEENHVGKMRKMKEEIMAAEPKKKDKIVKVRMGEVLLSCLQKEAVSTQMSLSGYINLTLTSSVKKHAVAFEEKIDRYEKKESRIRVCLTASETALLKQHAVLNNWSLTKEVRYRILSSLAKKPKLNKDELKAIYAVRSSINVLGANVNRLVRESTPLSDHNIDVCKELVILLKELKDKISYLEKCSSSNFKLKARDGVDER